MCAAWSGYAPYAAVFSGYLGTDHVVEPGITQIARLCPVWTVCSHRLPANTRTRSRDLRLHTAFRLQPLKVKTFQGTIRILNRTTTWQSSTACYPDLIITYGTIQLYVQEISDSETGLCFVYRTKNNYKSNQNLSIKL